ncbi:hypothetical protein [Nonomuraea insulae]|uniref:Uncharacterized protein n=1 Tax=Nonomuraea insulae TaxID=1616787 RepID=A0ABW1D1V1_9ACTN
MEDDAGEPVRLEVLELRESMSRWPYVATARSTIAAVWFSSMTSQVTPIDW